MSLPTRHRVAVYHSNSDIRVETHPLPQLGAGELLLQVHASGICGSDIMEWYRKPKAPLVLGHEVAGRVVAVGHGLNGLHEGDRIVATHHVPCLECRYCRSGRETACEMLRHTNFDPGGFAEYVRLPAANVERGVLRIPDHVSDEAGSMVEPLGCAVRGARSAGLREGHTVLVIGAGVSGCMHILTARARGAARVYASDPNPKRRAFAEQIGAERAFDSAEPVGRLIRDELGRGVDLVIVCAGVAAAVDQALTAVDRGGRVLMFAPLGPGHSYPLPFDDVFWRHQATLVSSYGAGPGDLAEALALLKSRAADVERLVTHRLPLGKVQHGFALMVAAKDSLKVIIDPRLDGEKT